MGVVGGQTEPQLLRQTRTMSSVPWCLAAAMARAGAGVHRALDESLPGFQ